MKLFNKVFGRLNKKILILLILLLISVAAIATIVVKKKFQNNEPDVISRYEIEDDSISSILTIVGERELLEVKDENASGLHKVKYVYNNLTTGSEDVKAYTEFLMEECGFVPLMNFDLTNPAGYISVATNSVEEGYLLQIDIDYTSEDYTIILSRSEGELPMPKEEEKRAFTRSDAQAFLNTCLPEDLGLQEPLSSYITIFDQGRMIIDGKDCYGINVYQKGVGQSNEIVGKYFVALDKSQVYKYNVSDNSYALVYHDVAEEEKSDVLTKEQKENLAKVHESIKAAVNHSLDLLLQ